MKLHTWLASIRLGALLLLLVPTLVLAQTNPQGPLGPPPGYILEDDMWIPPSDSGYTATPWPSGIVPYTFDSAISNNERNLFRKALAEIEAVSDVDFVVHTSQANYIYIQHNGQDNVSSSALGMVGGAQAINVGANHWTIKYVLVHELYHALGFIHEQQRPDRNSFVTINTANISQTACGGNPCNHNFTMDPAAFMPTNYDYLSIMHYGQNAFSNGAGPTITCVNASFQTQIGNRNYLSDSDAVGMAVRYGLPDAPTITSILPSSVYAGSPDTWIYVTGLHFYEGSDVVSNLIGTRVGVNSVPIDTIYIDETSVLGIIPASMLATPSATNSIQVFNGAYAGGSSNSVNFSVLAPPCSTQGDETGKAVAGLGDVNFDGQGDYVVGSPGYNGQGAVFCYAGQTNQVLWSRFGLTGEEQGHSLAAIGDVSGDGINDVILGAPGYLSNRGRAYVVNGATGGNLLTINGTINSEQYGWAVSGVGDVNGDSVPDVIIGAPFSGGGRVQVRSGATAAIIYTISESQTDAYFGYSVAGGYDATGDGITDFAVGTPNFDSAFLGESPLTDRGRINIYTGATGASVAARYGDGHYDFLGRSVGMSPSLTNSGNAFTFAGASDVGDLGGAFGGPGYVRAYRGFQTFNAYATWQTWNGAATGDQFGQAVSYVGDLNDDGFCDIAVGASQGGVGAFATAVGPGYVAIRAGSTGNELFRKSGASTGDRFGWSVTGLGDSNGNAVSDFLVGSPFRDVPCLNAGTYTLVDPPIPPVRTKLLITEISTYEPDGLEITNFGTTSIGLSGWSVIWRPTGLGTLVEVALPSATLQPGEIAVVKEPGGSISELPSSTQVFAVLPALSTSTQGLIVALRSPSGLIVDEVRTGGITGSVGGRFRGDSPNFSFGMFATSRNHERIWGLDSNCGADWITHGIRSFGLENTGGGLSRRGTDPIPKFFVRINEIDTSPDFVELYTPLAVNLQGFELLQSNNHGTAHSLLKPWPDSYPLGSSAYLVLGSSSTPPAELPSGVLYRNIAAIGGAGTLALSTSEFSVALYDRYGRVADLVRSTGHDDNVVHNHPRAPSAWNDFMGSAQQHAQGDATIGRNGTASDTNTESDWTTYTTRTMGSSNQPGITFIPSADALLDVRANSGSLGGSLTFIINAGEENAGNTWTFTLSLGHLQGTGPLIGLGPDALANYQLLSTTPPWFGTLDTRGSARVDLPSSTVPPGLMADLIFFLQNPTGAYLQYTSILEWDS